MKSTAILWVLSSGLLFSNAAAGDQEQLHKIIQENRDFNQVWEAKFELAKIHAGRKEWDQVQAILSKINQGKKHYTKAPGNQAEVSLLLGQVAESKKDYQTAAKRYRSVVETYPAYPKYSIEAFYRYFIIARSAIDTQDPDEKRQRELALYQSYYKYLYIWQNLASEDSPTGALKKLRDLIGDTRKTLHISKEDEADIKYHLGIDAGWQP